MGASLGVPTKTLEEKMKGFDVPSTVYGVGITLIVHGVFAALQLLCDQSMSKDLHRHLAIRAFVSSIGGVVTALVAVVLHSL